MPIPASPSEVIERKSLREMCTARIQDAILDGRLQAGESLNDRELGAWLGVSRTPVREALADLERLGLVEMKAQSYTRIASPDPTHRRELIQALGAAVGGAVRLTVPVLTEQQHGRLLNLTASVLACADACAADRYEIACDSLLNEVLECCPNQYLVDACTSARQALRFHEVLTRERYTPAWESLPHDYATLLDALTVRDAVAAELAIECVFDLGRE